MESMTGYSYTEDSSRQFMYTVELKTLNSRYQEVYVNVPRILRYEETEMTGILKKEFSRGKIELTIDISEWSEPREVQINSELIQMYHAELSRVEKILKTEQSFSLDPILGFDGVLSKGRTQITDQSLKKIYATIDQSIKKTRAMRNKEGKSVEKDIKNSLKIISDRVALITKSASFSSKEQFAKLKKRLADAGCQSTEDSRIFTEIALLADKLDINEEISRLKNHITKFKDVLKTEESLGKKLDFLCQEMFREINTIAAKSNSAEISHHVVDVKNCIDKIREQCRNIV